MPKFWVTIEGASFDIEADDEDAAIEAARDEAVITVDSIDDDEDDEDDDEV